MSIKPVTRIIPAKYDSKLSKPSITKKSIIHIPFQVPLSKSVQIGKKFQPKIPTNELNRKTDLKNNLKKSYDFKFSNKLTTARLNHFKERINENNKSCSIVKKLNFNRERSRSNRSSEMNSNSVKKQLFKSNAVIDESMCEQNDSLHYIDNVYEYENKENNNESNNLKIEFNKEQEVEFNEIEKILENNQITTKMSDGFRKLFSNPEINLNDEEITINNEIETVIPTIRQSINSLRQSSILFPTISIAAANENNHMKRQSFDLNSSLFDSISLQERINRLDLGYISSNFNNYQINKEFKANFSQEEFRQLSTALILNEYGEEMLNDMFDLEENYSKCLSNHGISERMRMRMLDWMIEVLCNYKCSDNTYFYASYIMDKLFKESVNSFKPEDLHLIGITCIYLASKFNDIYPLKLRVMSDKVSHNKFSPLEISNKQIEIVRIINYNFSFVTIFDFVNFYIEKIFFFVENNFQITNDVLSEYLKPLFDDKVFKFDNNFHEKIRITKVYNSQFITLLRRLVLYLSKMSLYDIELNEFKPSFLAAATLLVAVKICEDINSEAYINEYFSGMLVNLSRKSYEDILSLGQRILFNAQNYDKLFSNLENLKKYHFNVIGEAK